MSDDFSYESLLELTREELGEERSLPTGHWRLKIIAAKFGEVTGRGEGAPLAQLNVATKPVEPTDDVSPVELEGFNFAEEKVFHRFPVFVKKDMHNIRRFAEALGVDTAQGTVAEWAKAMKGGTYVGMVKHRDNPEDETRPYVEVRTFQKDE